MWNSKIARKASLAIGGIGVVAFPATIFFDANIRVQNSAKSQLTNTRVNLTEGFVYKKRFAHEIKSEQASSFWVFPKRWFSYLGTEGEASWAISQSDVNGELKHQKMFVIWSAELFKGRKLGVGVTKPYDKDAFFNNVESFEFDRLLKDGKIDAYKMIHIKKGHTNKVIVDTGDISIVASKGLKWWTLMNVEVKESNKKESLVEQPIAKKESLVEQPIACTNEIILETEAAIIRSLDTEAHIGETNYTEIELKNMTMEKKEKLKLALMLLLVILGAK